MLGYLFDNELHDLKAPRRWNPESSIAGRLAGLWWNFKVAPLL
jgi:hypothetical protein